NGWPLIDTNTNCQGRLVASPLTSLTVRVPGGGQTTPSAPDVKFIPFTIRGGTAGVPFVPGAPPAPGGTPLPPAPPSPAVVVVTVPAAPMATPVPRVPGAPIALPPRPPAPPAAGGRLGTQSE